MKYRAFVHPLRACAVLASAITAVHCSADEPTPLSVIEEQDRVLICHGDRPVATYCLRHRDVPRPFYFDLYAPTGDRISRKFPPVAGEEATDHELLHPGLWLAFGDMNGVDFWRNQGRIEHIEFVAKPRCEGERLIFVVRNEYRNGNERLCSEVCRHTISLHGGNYLIEIDSTFSNADKQVTFGDQEEMGLGLRLTAALCVKNGNGRILNSEGQENESQTWGKQADWCDLSGTLDDRHVGVLLMTHPDNFGRSWFHVRDYGLCVANPFGRKAFTNSAASEVAIKPGESLRLRFGVVLHGTARKASIDPTVAYREYLVQARKREE